MNSEYTQVAIWVPTAIGNLPSTVRCADARLACFVMRSAMATSGLKSTGDSFYCSFCIHREYRIPARGARTSARWGRCVTVASLIARGCSTSGSVSTGMGDRIRRAYCPGILPSHPGQLNLSRTEMSTGQRAVTLCGWGGNRTSGVALAMHHRL